MVDNNNSTVFIVDDCAELRVALMRLLMAEGYRVRAFESAEAFLADPVDELPACLILDIKMPGESGTALQERLVAMNRNMPVIFLSGHADVPTTVKAMKLGAVDFLQKPVAGEALLAAIEVALGQSRCHQSVDDARARWESLTKREKQVLRRVVGGALNKQIADEFDLHEQTIKQHRGSVMKKMQAGSLAELVRISTSIGIEPSKVSVS